MSWNHTTWISRPRFITSLNFIIGNASTLVAKDSLKANTRGRENICLLHTLVFTCKFTPSNTDWSLKEQILTNLVSYRMLSLSEITKFKARERHQFSCWYSSHPWDGSPHTVLGVFNVAHPLVVACAQRLRLLFSQLQHIFRRKDLYIPHIINECPVHVFASYKQSVQSHTILSFIRIKKEKKNKKIRHGLISILSWYTWCIRDRRKYSIILNLPYHNILLSFMLYVTDEFLILNRSKERTEV